MGWGRVRAMPRRTPVRRPFLPSTSTSRASSAATSGAAATAAAASAARASRSLVSWARSIGAGVTGTQGRRRDAWFPPDVADGDRARSGRANRPPLVARWRRMGGNATMGGGRGRRRRLLARSRSPVDRWTRRRSPKGRWRLALTRLRHTMAVAAATRLEPWRGSAGLCSVRVIGMATVCSVSPPSGRSRATPAARRQRSIF